MIENARKMMCGNCGGESFAMFELPDGLAAECEQCRSTSVIRASRPKIEIGWGEKSEGVLCRKS